MFVPAGAAYDRRLPADTRYTNAYNFVRLDLEARSGVAYFRRWSDRGTRWIEDTDTHLGGCYEFKLPGHPGAAKPLSAQVRGSIGSVERATMARIEAAERRYRELLLESCDIIDLANLPEQDRHLAHRQLELRRLYVPLRVQVEARAETEARDEIWDALEKRRGGVPPSWSEDPKETSKLERSAVGERLATAKRLVVLGDPGAGKTTLTRWIATAYLLRLKSDPDWRDLPDVQTLPDADWLPILVRCRDLDATCLRGALDDILEHTLRKAELREEEAADVQQLLRDKIDGRKALLIIDGLDEIADPAIRARFCGQVDKIASAHRDLPIIGTSRIVGYREMGRRLSRSFEHLTLADLTRDEKDQFARRWCDLTERLERRTAAAKELIADIHSSDRIERLTGNPMLLTTMALVKRKVGKLPQRRADLYSEVVQVLLNWRREVDEPLDYREAIPQLEYLAYAMCDRGVQQLRDDEVVELFTQMREQFPKVHAAQARSPEEFLRLLESRTGILVEAGHTRHLGRTVPVLEFRHLTFQEYLAARALVDGCFPDRNVELSLAESVAPLAGRVGSASEEGEEDDVAVVESWREVLRLCVAICHNDDVDDVLLAVLQPREDEPKSTSRARAAQAALCLADEPNVSDEVGEKIAQAFSKQTGPRDGLGPWLTSFDRAAVELGGTRWTTIFADTLVAEYFQVDADSCIGPAGLVATLIGARAPSQEAELTSWLAKRVRQLRDPDERMAAQVALGVMHLAFHDRIALVPGLIAALLDRLFGSAPMSRAAAWALGWLGSRGPQPIWKPQGKELDNMIAFVGSPESDADGVRFLTWVLREARIEAAVDPLVSWLSNRHSLLRIDVATALGQIGSERATDALVARLDDDDADVRQAAATALGQIGGERAADALVARLDDDGAQVRRAAARALGQIGSERAADALVARLDDDNADMRQAAARALGQIGSERATGALVARLDDGNAEVRQAAATALGQIGSERATDALVARLDDNDADVRRAALGGLAHSLMEVDRKLLSVDLDELPPFVDPREPISRGQIGRAASVLDVSVDEVQHRYEVLAERYGLQLERPPAE